jgi:hypothetical protein
MTVFTHLFRKEVKHAVAQLLEALLCKPECRCFEFWNFSMTSSFRPHSGSEFTSSSNKNEYQEYFLGGGGGKGGRCGVGLTTLPPSCADCLEIWEPQPPGTLRACNRPVQGLIYLFYCAMERLEVPKYVAYVWWVYFNLYFIQHMYFSIVTAHI